MYAPHCYDPQVYYPRDASDAISMLDIEGRYVVGVVAANVGYPSRKAWPEIFEGFKLFHDQHPEAVLYAHTHWGTEYGGVDLRLLQEAVGLLNPSRGEGFGVPLLEAQACGTPIIAGDWTAMPELHFSGELIPKSDATRTWIPRFSYQYVVHPQAVCDALEKVYATTIYKPSPLVEDYEADKVVAKYWPRILTALEAATEMPNVELVKVS